MRASIEDLLSIEINTVIKSGMTTQRPPAFPLQLLEIAKCYQKYLANNNFNTNLLFADDQSWQAKQDSDLLSDLDSVVNTYNPQQTDIDKITNGSITFRKLRVIAKYASLYLERHQLVNVIEQDETLIMLLRLRRNSMNIAKILEKYEKEATLNQFFDKIEEEIDVTNFRLKDYDFNDITTVRKIWEIGTSAVIMQTVVQAEGDVITRISPRLIDAQIGTDLREVLLRIHSNSVTTATSQWKELISIIISLVDAIRNWFK